MILTRRTLLKTSAMASIVGLGGCSTPSQTGSPTSEPNIVDMTDDLTFAPETITISTGETVTWENVSSLGHTVTAYGEKIPSDANYFASGGYEDEQAARDAYKNTEGGNIDPDGSYSHTFEITGDYEYFCIPHERAGMKGTVTVEK